MGEMWNNVVILKSHLLLTSSASTFLPIKKIQGSFCSIVSSGKDNLKGEGNHKYEDRRQNTWVQRTPLTSSKPRNLRYLKCLKETLKTI